MKKYVAFIFALLILSACAFSPVVDQATFDVTATARAMPVPPLPTMDNPTVPPTPTEALVPTVTPCPLVIKGNINANGDKIAHSPGQANYNTVVIEASKGEKLFCTLADAEAEGWRPAQK